MTPEDLIANARAQIARNARIIAETQDFIGEAEDSTVRLEMQTGAMVAMAASLEEMAKREPETVATWLAATPEPRPKTHISDDSSSEAGSLEGAGPGATPDSQPHVPNKRRRVRSPQVAPERALARLSRS